jgi:hypothetical protein
VQLVFEVGTFVILQVKFVPLDGVMKNKPKADVLKSTVHELLVTVTEDMVSTTRGRVCCATNVGHTLRATKWLRKWTSH